jgi:hypothetical protein
VWEFFRNTNVIRIGDGMGLKGNWIIICSDVIPEYVCTWHICNKYLLTLVHKSVGISLILTSNNPILSLANVAKN